MRNSKLNTTDVTHESINAPRPSTLRVNKDSHGIHKSSSFPAAASPAGKRQPVIIYTQSPRIIHTQAHEFMTLVQKLTGLDRAGEEKEENRAKSDHSEDSTTDEVSISNEDNKNNVVTDVNNNYFYVGNEENESSSVLTTNENSSPVSSVYKVSSANVGGGSYLIDDQVFGPGSSDFLCSRPSSLFDHRPMSPSIFDVMRGYPEY